VALVAPPTAVALVAATAAPLAARLLPVPVRRAVLPRVALVLLAPVALVVL